MNRDELEFLISQYVDGQLPPMQRAALEERLAADPEAQRLHEAYRALDQAMGNVQPLPPVLWDRFAQRISAAAAEQAPSELAASADDTAVPEELEYRLTQYLDGEMSHEESEALTAVLDVDPAAQQSLARHRRLDVLLKHGWPVPDVQWDRLARSISDRIAEVHPGQSRYSITAWLTWGSRVAAAACILLIFGLIAYFASHTDSGSGGANPHIAQVVVEGPELAEGSPSIQVQFGPSEAYVSGQYDPYSSPVVSVPSQVEIASTLPRHADGGWWPF